MLGLPIAELHALVRLHEGGDGERGVHEGRHADEVGTNAKVWVRGQDGHRVGAKVGAGPGAVVCRGPVRGPRDVHVRVASERGDEDAQLVRRVGNVHAEVLARARLEVLGDGDARLQGDYGLGRGGGDGVVGGLQPGHAEEVRAPLARPLGPRPDRDGVGRRARLCGREVVEGLSRRKAVVRAAHKEVGGARLGREGEGHVVVRVADGELVVDEAPPQDVAILRAAIDEHARAVAGLLQRHLDARQSLTDALAQRQGHEYRGNGHQRRLRQGGRGHHEQRIVCVHHDHRRSAPLLRVLHLVCEEALPAAHERDRPAQRAPGERGARVRRVDGHHGHGPGTPDGQGRPKDGAPRLVLAGEARGLSHLEARVDVVQRS
mmetsp:Transcript_18166/g.57093  ORF Transcript_18166/g.57093 Transcript_18166/m.57093 type:complete len:376 (-) Transcript_18166:4280-5407(-)